MALETAASPREAPRTEESGVSPQGALAVATTRLVDDGGVPRPRPTPLATAPEPGLPRRPRRGGVEMGIATGLLVAGVVPPGGTGGVPYRQLVLESALSRLPPGVPAVIEGGLPDDAQPPSPRLPLADALKTGEEATRHEAARRPRPPLEKEGSGRRLLAAPPLDGEGVPLDGLRNRLLRVIAVAHGVGRAPPPLTRRDAPLALHTGCSSPVSYSPLLLGFQIQQTSPALCPQKLSTLLTFGEHHPHFPRFMFRKFP